ncbi:dephospho-CoA kinase [Bifidobacterium castoris]|uniref:Dephospho-CoA kinase n=1 Tax=Bifidobacterium castoris TaxID=2306972 RepID=A0A430F9Y1_9BIFI|nr:dephospho-CoA kinase [Bifidobacterium castoris]RSX49637.1 dephospho-CoA kinase [Bifidobacterium castoris]
MQGKRRRLVRVGLTGGIAAGKSTVAARMAADGADVIDYDFLAHILQEPCSPVIAPIAEAFGDDVLDARGGIDRKALADRVFGADAPKGALETLNGIMHPNVYELARNRERSILSRGACHVVVHDIPLLGEVMETIPFVFDVVVCVVAPEDERVRRLVATRGMTPEQARVRVEEQGSDAARLRYADVVIDAAQPIEQMFDYVDNLVETWFDEE